MNESSKNIPRHVGIIIDGNRRWAVKNGLLKLEGHRRGAENLKKLIPVVIKRGIPAISVFTFSTENWRRPPEEVAKLMNLIAEVFRDYFDWLKDQGVQVRVSGRTADFSEDLRQIFKDAVEATKENTKLIANFCLGYGGREEIVQMVRRIAVETKGDEKAIAKIDEEMISRNLYTAGLPDADLMIRTGGEKRLSGFLPWQSVYAELYFTETLWPDFDEAEFDRALVDFANRKRNFGV